MTRAFWRLGEVAARATAGVALLLCSMAALPSPASAKRVLVAAAQADAGSAPLAEGYTDWLRHRLRGAGLTVLEFSAATETAAARRVCLG